MITLDTSALLALVDRSDPDHERIEAALYVERFPWLVPAGILGEVGYMLERLGMEVVRAFADDLDFGPYTLDCGEGDFRRISQLVGRYSDLPLGLADASVMACAERNGGRVLTLDRHFWIVSGDVRITIIPGME